MIKSLLQILFQYLWPIQQRKKLRIFKQYSGNDVIFFETGTHRANTTRKLANWNGKVISIEPSSHYFSIAKKKTRKFNNVFLYNGKSEDLLAGLISSNLEDSFQKFRFFLDGHYSGGLTFDSGNVPILDELEAISLLNANHEVKIFIDDARLILNRKPGYPSVNQISSWAKRHNFEIHVTEDMYFLSRK